MTVTPIRQNIVTDDPLRADILASVAMEYDKMKERAGNVAGIMFCAVGANGDAAPGWILDDAYHDVSSLYISRSLLMLQKEVFDQQDIADGFA